MRAGPRRLASRGRHCCRRSVGRLSARAPPTPSSCAASVQSCRALEPPALASLRARAQGGHGGAQRDAGHPGAGHGAAGATRRSTAAARPGLLLPAAGLADLGRVPRFTTCGRPAHAATSGTTRRRPRREGHGASALQAEEDAVPQGAARQPREGGRDHEGRQGLRLARARKYYMAAATSYA